jgi:hypothetical protein
LKGETIDQTSRTKLGKVDSIFLLCRRSLGVAETAPDSIVVVL